MNDARTVFRSRGPVIGTEFMGVAVGAGLVLKGRGSPLGWVLGVGFAIFAILYATRWLGVEATAGGIRVHQQIGSSLIPWSDIDRFEIGEKYPWPVWLITTTGVRVRTWGIQSTPFGSAAVTQSLVDSLNDLVRRHRAE